MPKAQDTISSASSLRQNRFGSRWQNRARFGENGTKGTGVSDIIKDAGLTQGGMCKHFDDKDASVRAGWGHVRIALRQRG